MADLFREVDEDLRRDKLQQLWRRYGGYLIACAAAIVLGTAGYVGWQKYAESQRLRHGAAYVAAMEQLEREDAAASDALAELGAGGTGYAVLARLQEASHKAKVGDAEGALAIYDAISTEEGLPSQYRDMASVLYVLHSIDTGDPAALDDRLAPLTEADHPWRHIALELSGLLAKRVGDVAKAREIFRGLVDDPATPSALRQRAAELAAALPR